MAVTNVRLERYDANTHKIFMAVDGVEVSRRFAIPDPVPEGLTKKQFIKHMARILAEGERARVIKEAEHAAIEAKWEGTPTNRMSDAAEIQQELNA